jgi:hypothetical protein
MNLVHMKYLNNMFENCPTRKRIIKENIFNSKCEYIWKMFKGYGLFKARESVKKYCDEQQNKGNNYFKWGYVKYKIIEKSTFSE